MAKEERPRPPSDDSAIDEAMAHDVIQQGGDRSIPKQTQIERAIQQHPRREIPRVASIEPPEIP